MKLLFSIRNLSKPIPFNFNKSFFFKSITTSTSELNELKIEAGKLSKHYAALSAHAADKLELFKNMTSLSKSQLHAKYVVSQDLESCGKLAKTFAAISKEGLSQERLIMLEQAATEEMFVDHFLKRYVKTLTQLEAPISINKP